MNERINNMKFDKKIVVWGIGIRGKDFIEYIGQENVGHY